MERRPAKRTSSKQRWISSRRAIASIDAAVCHDARTASSSAGGKSVIASAGFRRVALGLAIAASLTGAGRALADEGGVSFWLPGQYSSFAAMPSNPGLSYETIYY